MQKFDVKEFWYTLLSMTTFYRTNHNEITTKLSISIDLINEIFFHFRGFKGGAYSRAVWVAYLIILFLELGTYSNGTCLRHYSF